MSQPTNNFSLKFSELTDTENKTLQKPAFVVTELRGLGFHKINFLTRTTIVFFLVLLFSVTKSFGQRDQITTQAGEKIRCRIVDETPTKFIYVYLSPTGKILRNEIFKNLVSDFKYNYYPENLITKGNKVISGSDTKETGKSGATPEKTTKQTTPADTKATTSPPKQAEKTVEKEEKTIVKDDKANAPLTPKKEKNEFDNYLKFRVGVRGGFGNMLAKIDAKDEYGLYQEKLLRGWTWGADFSYFPTDNFGFGIMFHDFQSKNSAQNIKYRFLKNGELIDTTGSLNNKRSAKFVGPVFYFRKNIDYKTMVILGLAPGAYFYNDKGEYNGTKIPYKGWDFGGAATLGIDFMLGNDITGRDIILSLEAGYNYGQIRSMDFSDGKGTVKLAKPLDLSRVDFTIGLRFTRYPRYLSN